MGAVGAGDLYQGALFVGEAHLRKHEHAHAARAFARAAALAETAADRELARGLVHLAAAGRRRADPLRRERQLAHARRRLAPFLPAARRLALAELVALVEAGG
jgi:hypothetical protein